MGRTWKIVLGAVAILVILPVLFLLLAGGR
jgi:hypothetical protein